MYTLSKENAIANMWAIFDGEGAIPRTYMSNMSLDISNNLTLDREGILTVWPYEP